MAAVKGEVCVTGAGGFIASWVVKKLLEQGFRVRGTVRDPASSKNAHLLALPNASTHLTLVAADLMNEGSFDAAVAGCEGVYHTASPFFFKNGTRENLVEPAIRGTTTVLDACAKAGTVKRVVLTASMASVAYNGGKLPHTHVYTDKDWSDTEVLEAGKIWYPLSKTLAEKAGWEHEAVKSGRLSLVVINPTLVCGPLLQPTLNTSSELVLGYLNGSNKTIPQSTMGFVDVRDVADLHINAMNNPDANGRYLTIMLSSPWVDTCNVLRRVAPKYADNIPTAVADGAPPNLMLFDNSRTRELLGHDWITQEQTLRATVEGLEEQKLI